MAYLDGNGLLAQHTGLAGKTLIDDRFPLLSHIAATAKPEREEAVPATNAGVTRPAPDACGHGVPRSQCRVGCGYRCTVARREREAAARAAVRLPSDAELRANLLTLTTASPSVAADHTACGTASCCGICNQGEPTT